MKGFGSDGYRGIIGYGFTREALLRIAIGIIELVRTQNPELKNPLIPIGFDTRFLSRESANFLAAILASDGFKPQIAHCPCPSPYLAYATRKLDSPLGIQVTASHNPYFYNGVKLKGRHGGSLLAGDVRLIEAAAVKADPANYDDLPFIGNTGPDEFNLTRQYRQALEEAARNPGNPQQNLVVDYLHGAAGGIYHDLLQERYQLNTELRVDSDPLFEYAKPEPSPENLEELCAQVRYDGRDSVGLAFDGDGDRLAVADEDGRLLETHEIFSILLEHTVLNLGFRGPVIKTVSFSGMIDRIAAELGCPVIEVPVGYKSVSEAMLEHQAVIGGEESGGTGFGHYLPERDALLMAMLVLDARQLSGMKLSEMVEDIYSRYGRLEFVRVDLPTDLDLDRAELQDRIDSLAAIQTIGRDAVTSHSRHDGLKLVTQTGWVLVRPSGTENLLRIYAEAPTSDQASAYSDAIISELEPITKA